MCKYYTMFGRCVFLERCSFLHFSSSECDHTASAEFQGIKQEVSKLREVVKTLRAEEDELEKGTDALSSEP